MPLKTTVIGSFPQPSFLKVPNWFEAKMGLAGDFISNYNAFTKQRLDEGTLEEAFREVISLQTDIGIDVITDGELKRDSYVHYFCRKIQGFDFENPVVKVYRNGACKSEVPCIVSRLAAPLDPWVCQEWKRSQAYSKVPVKATIPGPLTIVNTVENKYYDDEKELTRDLVNIISVEVCALARAGCRYIQIDEPLLMRQPDLALEYGIDNLSKCFTDLPGHVVKVIHLCCGYPNYLDEEGYAKADRTNYFRLAEKLDNGGFDEISIEDAHCYNDLSLLAHFKKSKVILGVLGIARSRVESVEEIRQRLLEALQYIPSERLIVAPDCGCGFLSMDLATKKLKAMVEAARSIQ